MIDQDMGVTYVEGRGTGPTGLGERIRFLVDSGAQYSLVPLDVWTRIGLIEKRKQRFTLGDGRTIERGVSECHVALPQGDAHTPAAGERAARRETVPAQSRGSRTSGCQSFSGDFPPQ